MQWVFLRRAGNAYHVLGDDTWPYHPLAAFSTGNLSNGTVAGPAAVNSNGSSPGYMGGGRSLTFGGSYAAAHGPRNGSGHHSTSTFQEVVSKAISVDEKLSASRCEEKISLYWRFHSSYFCQFCTSRVAFWQGGHSHGPFSLFWFCAMSKRHIYLIRGDKDKSGLLWLNGKFSAKMEPTKTYHIPNWWKFYEDLAELYKFLIATLIGWCN